ncbi:MAG: methylenetetrahydrofolate--tRNA-(uracil(54)-C(5))-methyltransferase (FADH(2)-oxidizing) TrmFO [Pseudomonadota bacterium]
MKYGEQAPVLVIGGGLAGSEAAWQLLRAGLSVELVEARPTLQSPAHRSLLMGELVCTNSLRSDSAHTAAGLLKAEMRRVGSLLLNVADIFRVPAGSALAVDRWAFAWRVTSTLVLHPRFQIRRHAVEKLPDGPCILATGPLTTAKLAEDLKRRVGSGLYFYDAMAPVVEAESIDWEKVFLGARRDQDSDDYVNCPLDREQYDLFVQELRKAKRVVAHPFEEEKYFEGCLPLEVMAQRGDDVLAFGPLRPVGLMDPSTGRRPYAVVQLRAENEARTLYNLVGFQTRLTYGEQKRVFRMIPGLEEARFERMGSIHRNSYLDAPRIVDSRLGLVLAPHVKVAGQLAGVEGYLESAALGQVVGLLMAAELKGVCLEPPPVSTALGALTRHVSRPRAMQEVFSPSHITFGLMPSVKVKNKRERRVAICNRAMEDLETWIGEVEGLGLE